MIFFVTSAQNQSDIIVEEATQAGCTNIKPFVGGVEFEADLKAAYTFCLTSRVSTRVLLGLYEDDGVASADDLYAASVLVPWEQWVDPKTTFSVTETVKHTDWLRNSHFAAIRLKDAIVDRIRSKFDGERPMVNVDHPDVTFHLHLDAGHVCWYVDFSGKALYKRGYRKDETDAVLAEYLASAVLWRSDWRKALHDDPDHAPVFLDPFCGSGTLAIEAALMATDTAPGIVDPHRTFAFQKLPGYDEALFQEVKESLIEKAKEGRKRAVDIYAWDISRRAIRIAKENAEAAGVADLIHFGVQDFTDLTQDDVPAPTGYIVTDPPYGVRMEADEPMQELYTKIGTQLSTLFMGWHASILCGDQRLLANIDMKPDRTNTVSNGGIPCQLAHYYIFTAEEKEERTRRAQERKAERLAQPLNEDAQRAYDRIKKNLDRLEPLMAKQGVTCFRIYDSDIPEFNASIDWYEHQWIVLSEYEAPATVEEADAQKHLQDLIDATERVTGTDPERIFLKKRSRQTGKNQYPKFADTKKFYIIHENGCRFLVNFTDYLDTGLFLDHRPIRAGIQSMAKGKRFLNLFCYTGSATVDAAKGGALSTVSVDASSTYLDWARENMRLNQFTGMNHFFYKDDVIPFLRATYDRFDLIFCDPPTYSNSKMRGTFDVQRDHVDLIKACMMHLDSEGTLIFSCNFRKFHLAPFLDEDYDILDITPQTIGDDFSGDPNVHHCFLIKHKTVRDALVKVRKTTTLKAVRKESEHV